MTWPVAMSKAANNVVVPCRLYPWLNPFSALPLGSRSQPCARSKAWIDGFSSTHKTKAFSGGLKYSPTMSAAFGPNSGSVLMHQLRRRCRQMSCLRKTRQNLCLESDGYVGAIVDDNRVGTLKASQGVGACWVLRICLRHADKAGENQCRRDKQPFLVEHFVPLRVQAETPAKSGHRSVVIFLRALR